jgi:signal transduction histidine kinase
MELIHRTLTGERWETVEIEIFHIDKTVRTLLWNSATLFMQDGKTPLATIAQGQDITKRKQVINELNATNEELQKLNAQKDKFFSIVAHDLKGPFSNILGLSEILCEKMQESDYGEIEMISGLILNSSKKAMNLLVNLLEWSRSQSGRIEFNPEFIQLFNLINESIELFTEAAKQKSITIHTNLTANALVHVDKAMISAVLRNLISNALKFTHLGGKIFISAEVSKNELKVTIKDKGVGIAKDDIKKLFRIEESFTSSGTQNEKGTGLGLILCKEFIEKHGGKIWVESEEGQGSTFYFIIPVFNTL